MITLEQKARMAERMRQVVQEVCLDGYYETIQYSFGDLWFWKFSHLGNRNTLVVTAKPYQNYYEISVNGEVKKHAEIIKL